MGRAEASHCNITRPYRTLRSALKVLRSYFGRANANLNRGRKAQAKADLEKFLQLAPNYPLADQAKEWLKGL